VLAPPPPRHLQNTTINNDNPSINSTRTTKNTPPSTAGSATARRTSPTNIATFATHPSVLPVNCFYNQSDHKFHAREIEYATIHFRLCDCFSHVTCKIILCKKMLRSASGIGDGTTTLRLRLWHRACHRTFVCNCRSRIRAKRASPAPLHHFFGRQRWRARTHRQHAQTQTKKTQNQIHARCTGTNGVTKTD
jgi:hypothetical protein